MTGFIALLALSYKTDSNHTIFHQINALGMEAENTYPCLISMKCELMNILRLNAEKLTEINSIVPEIWQGKVTTKSLSISINLMQITSKTLLSNR